MNTTAAQGIAFSRPWLGKEEEVAAAEVIASGWLVGGARQREFERQFAAACGADHAIAVSSWTTGAFLLLHAVGIEPGDEVIVPSLTFIASVNVIRHAGATPVFADIDKHTYNVDPADIERKITPRTRLILPVDQIGLPCDMEAIAAIAKRQGARVLQDAACSFASRSNGRPVGSYCELSCFSLHARKIITTGEGGMIVTSDNALAERLRRLRHQGMSLSDFDRHGSSPTVFEAYDEIGFNYRMTDIQAAIGLAQIARLDEILRRRRAIAERYLAALREIDWIAPPRVPEGMQPNWQSFQIALRANAPLSRNDLMDKLNAGGIPTRRGVMASHLEPAYRSMNARLPVTERVAASSLQLPIHPGLTVEQQDYVIEALRAIA